MRSTKENAVYSLRRGYQFRSAATEHVEALSARFFTFLCLVKYWCRFRRHFDISRYDVACRRSQLFLLISRSRAFDVRFWFCTFRRTISCLHVDFEGFKLALCSTFRQNEVFWLVQAINMTRRSAIALRLPNWSKLTVRFCLDSHDFLTVLTTRLPISWFLAKYIKKGNVYCCWIVIDSPHVNPGNCSVQPSARDGDFGTVLRDTCRP